MKKIYLLVAILGTVNLFSMDRLSLCDQIALVSSIRQVKFVADHGPAAFESEHDATGLTGAQAYVDANVDTIVEIYTNNSMKLPRIITAEWIVTLGRKLNIIKDN